MGIPGLMTFFASQDYVTEAYELKNEWLIIDGANLCHYLYRVKNIPWLYGGHYSTFEKAIKRFFSSLQQCNVKPIVLVDGCYEKNEQKFNTIRERRRQRLSSLRLLNRESRPHGNGHIIPPFLIQFIFIHCLKKFNIPFLQCPTEADNLIASLANEFNCPVLSQDSDFYIFPLRGGLIPLDTLQWRRITSTTTGLVCQLYHQHNIFLTGNVPADPQFMPLFASLMGNDYIKRQYFKSLFSNILNLRPIQHQRQRHVGLAMGKKQRAQKMIDILQWLNHFSTMSQAIDAISHFLPIKNREKILRQLSLSIQQYHVNSHHGHCLKDYFLSNPSDHNCRLTILKEFLHTIDNNIATDKNSAAAAVAVDDVAAFVVDLQNAHRHGYLVDFDIPFKITSCQQAFPNWFLNALNNYHTFSLIGVENVNEISLFEITMNLRRLCYQIALSQLPHDCSSAQLLLSRGIVEEGHKHGNVTKNVCLLTSTSLSSSLTMSMSLSEFLSLLELSEDVEIVSKLHEIQLPTILPILIFSQLFIQHLPKQKSHEEELFSLGLLVMLLLCLQSNLAQQSKHFAKYALEKPELNNFKVDIIHYFNLAQMIYYHFSLLCELCGQETLLDSLPPQNCFNDFFYYNLCQEFYQRTSPLLFAHEVCGGRRSLGSELLTILIQNTCPQFTFQGQQLQQQQQQKKYHKKKVHSKSTSQILSTMIVVDSMKESNNEQTPSSLYEGDCEDDEEDPYYDPNNRFALLPC